MALLATKLKLPVIDAEKAHPFAVPIKKINEGRDVPAFLTSRAYHDILTFLMQLNSAMFPRFVLGPNEGSAKVSVWETDSPLVSFSAIVTRLRQLLDKLGKIIDDVPPESGPRRFGNASFRKWSETVASQAPALLQLYLPSDLLARHSATEVMARTELESYLLGGFGSPQRLDYGTGHELSFLAFLGCIWKLGGFKSTASGEEERGIVLGVIEPYLRLVRRLIKTYTLEPAGSHGVWGLDDHSFIPYIFGSAQYAPAISNTKELPSEGSRHDAPNPADVANALIVEKERNRNLYFGAIGFIYDVKKGPFWEHSPMLFDISGVPKGWAKINKGMIKMYNAEVLSKFPVVQHFRFGSLFSWEQQPDSAPPVSIHTSNQPSKEVISLSTASRDSTPAHSQELSHISTPSSKSSVVDPVQESSKVSIPGLAQEVDKSTQPGYSQEVSKSPWATQLPAIPIPSLDTTAPWANQPAVEMDTASVQTSRTGFEQSAQHAVAEHTQVTAQPHKAENLGFGSMLPPARAPGP